ncbi:MAG: DUF5682 family protein [Tannerella sp.]|jgi:hypothetical protein|nr:DUF5682 family protein [Tannerella sp.]
MAGILRKPDIAEIENYFRESFKPESGQVVYFPVRHHSPACAWHLQRVIEQMRPDKILIEGPSDSNELLPFVADESSVAPFCIYYSYDDKDGLISESKEKYRAYYPFLDYSPELVGIREGAARKIPVEFIDIPYALRLVNYSLDTAEEEAETQYYYNEDKEFETNSYTAMIASRSGCRSFSEFWESRYELNAVSTDTAAFVRNVFYLGYFMRRTATEEASFGENLLRERFMAEKIKQYAGGNNRVLVVAGAFHIAGLMEMMKSDEKQALKKINRENAANYLMPYTFYETDKKSGYAAGMPFPAFYQEIWEKGGKKSGDVYQNTILAYIVKTARYARRTQTVSLPDEINAFNMARSLAMLRGKATTGVYELLDGVKSAFVKGDINATSTFEVDFLYRLLSGMGAGKIVAGTHMPPVVTEFKALCAQHRIKTSTIQRQEMTLDIIKNPAHRLKSRFLHQLLFLETSFATLLSGPDYVNNKDKNLVRETWVVRYSSQVETRLIDMSVYGATLSQICLSLIEKNFKDSLTAEELGKMLISVQVMGVEGFYPLYEDEIRKIIGGERNFTNLCKLISSLINLRHIQQLSDGKVEPLVDEFCKTVFSEAVIQLQVVSHANEDEEQEVAEQLRNLYGYMLGYDGFDNRSFLTAAGLVTEDSFSNSRVYGVCLGIRYKEGFIGQEDFCRRIHAYLESSMNQAEQAASFICGLFLVARDILFTDIRILQTMDKVIANAGNEQFISVLPNLRYAFTRFLPSEILRLGTMVAGYHQISDSQLEGSMLAPQKEIETGMLLDALASEALKEWRLGDE